MAFHKVESEASSREHPAHLLGPWLIGNRNEIAQRKRHTPDDEVIEPLRRSK